VEDYVTTYTSNPYGLPDSGLAGLSAIYADVIVPPAPVGTYYNLGSSGMTYFTFTAFEPSDGSEIVQPVLQYGWSQAGGGQNWAMATWDCGRPTGCLHSVLKTAYPGDSIHTWVYGQPTSWNALDFNVFMQDMTTGQQVINIYEPYKTMTNGFGNVVEAYSLYACNNYPYPSVTWKNITVYADTGLTKITPSWSYEPRGTSQSPQCTYGGQNGSTFLTLLHY
jgi:hypothetical protein